MRLEQRLRTADAAVPPRASAGSSDDRGRRRPPRTATGTGQGRQEGRLHLRRPEGRLRLQPGGLQGSQAVAKAYPDLEVLTAENVPEDDNADPGHGGA